MVKNLIIAIYSHPEYYPPTLNLIEHVSEKYDNILVIHRNVFGFDWIYPSNVELKSPCTKYQIREIEKAPLYKKIYWFFCFTFLLYRTINKMKPDTVILYDSIPTLSWRLICKWIPSPRLLWYHNHDVNDPIYYKKNSLSFLAAYCEKWIFKKLDIFSLPSIERKVYFPLNDFNGSFIFIPNFPSLRVMSRLNHNQISIPYPNNSFRILFQGSIGPMHGIEEIISILKNTINGKKIILVLKGFIDDRYKKELEDLALKFDVSNSILFISPTGYAEVIDNARTCHIGIGIHKKTDIMNQTLGTASNKIYEYASCGLPTLIYDNIHFRTTIGERDWVFFTNCTKQSLLSTFLLIDNNYEWISLRAFNDFKKDLNFENYISQIEI